MEQHRFGTSSGIVWRLAVVLIVVLTAVLAGDRASAEEAAPAPVAVVEDAVIGEALLIAPGQVVLGPATIITAAGVADAAAGQGEAQVLSASYERPSELPATGVQSSFLAAVGLALLGLGLVLVGLGDGRTAPDLRPWR